MQGFGFGRAELAGRRDDGEEIRTVHVRYGARGEGQRDGGGGCRGRGAEASERKKQERPMGYFASGHSTYLRGFHPRRRARLKSGKEYHVGLQQQQNPLCVHDSTGTTYGNSVSNIIMDDAPMPAMRWQFGFLILIGPAWTP
mmetsp:Transcript_41326/g.86722  ORF Transcript_41326/g.86722 Transcript_41326/m.86722 type:complete len:142 (-) Transcript_41326:206-631(-)